MAILDGIDDAVVKLDGRANFHPSPPWRLYCERLLVASAQAPDHSPFSPEELRRICFYAKEVAKIADAQRLQSNGRPALR
jgi:hypothetical protein